MSFHQQFLLPLKHRNTDLTGFMSSLYPDSLILLSSCSLFAVISNPCSHTCPPPRFLLSKCKSWHYKLHLNVCRNHMCWPIIIINILQMNVQCKAYLCFAPQGRFALILLFFLFVPTILFSTEIQGQYLVLACLKGSL